MKKPNHDLMISKLDALIEAMGDVLECWDENDTELDSVLAIDFPFPNCFRENYTDVIVWRNSVHSKLKGDNV